MNIAYIKFSSHQIAYSAIRTYSVGYGVVQVRVSEPIIRPTAFDNSVSMRLV